MKWKLGFYRDYIGDIGLGRKDRDPVKNAFHSVTA